MFSIEIDKHVSILFLHHQFKADFHKLYKGNKLRFSKWFDWPQESDRLSYFETLIKDALYDYARGKAVHCGISFDEQMIGYIGLTQINYELDKAQLRFLIAPKFEGRGIMHKVCAQMIAYSFDFLALQKLEMSIATEDLASRKACEALGFQLEGILKCADNIKGKLIDHARYGLIRSNYLKSQ
jgi:ribosomal-protein-serine acetyltransferase